MKFENEVEKQSSQRKGVVDRSKRSFSKASLAAPILMSFASRPTWAMVNCSFNQALSGDISNPGIECGPGLPSARSPGFFQGQDVSRWESEYQVTDAYFGSIFTQAPVVSIVTKIQGVVQPPNLNPTFKEILDAGGNDLIFDANLEETIFEPYEVNAMNARSLHYIAAYLCALSPVFIFPYTVSEITADWGQWHLFSKLQLILIDDGMTVQQVADTLGITV